MPFKVIQGHQFRYQSKARMRLPISDLINSNWHPISFRFRVIAAYCSNIGHCVFEPPFRGRLRDNVGCSFWAHWKACSVLPISVNWTFLLGVMAKVLRAKTDRKSAISLQRGHSDPKFQVERVAPTNHFCTVS